MELRLITAYVVLGFIALLEIIVLVLIAQGRINLNRLVSEPNGDASMSRFQLLIFTFVIAVALFLVIAVPNPPVFPTDIPSGVLTLLGISGTTYLVSKGIQFSSPAGLVDRPARVIVEPKTGKLAPGAPRQFTATVDRGDDTRVIWSIDSTPAYGTITKDGLYTAPAVAPPAGTKEVIKAASVADCRATGYADVTF